MAEPGDAGPELLPARMLNEFVYCPRLFYLEWVDDRWADNEDTAQGQARHESVNRRPQPPPGSDLSDLTTRMKSVRIESTRLGLVAVIDRLDGDDGRVIPVEIKKGSPGPDGAAWPADRMQVLVQAVLLMEAGHRVDEAVVYYSATHQRIRLPVDASTAGEVEQTVQEARRVAGAPLPPLPLVDSNKCPRCSLVGLCLPDETNALLARSDQPPRRIVPRDPDQRPLYVTRPGSHVGVRKGRIVVTHEREQVADLRAIDVSQLCLYGNVQVSSQALADLWARGVPVLWFSHGGWLRGWAQGEPSRYVELRRRQVAVHAQGGFSIAQAMVEGKVRNCRTLLRRNSREDVTSELDSLQRLAVQCRTASSASELLGIEGAAARLYFGRFPAMIGVARYSMVQGFVTDGRRRRPAPDPLNALLGYCYALLVKDMVAVCLAVGLDPYLGVYHRPRYGRPALALDLMEEFRAIICDSVVITMLNNGEVSEADFVQRRGAAWLTPDGRRAVLRAYERRLDTIIRHPVFGYRISYRRVLDVQARLLAAVMIGELDDYVPMVTR